MTPTDHAEEAVDAAHPLGVAAGQVVVDRDDVDALAGERVEVGGQRGDQRLAFAGLHLGDLAAVEDHAADQLDVEVPHVQRAAARLADDGEGLGQQVVERLARRRAAARNSTVLARSCSSESALIAASCALISATSGREALELALVRGAEDFREGFVDDHLAVAGLTPALQTSGYRTIVPRIRRFPSARESRGRARGWRVPRVLVGEEGHRVREPPVHPNLVMEMGARGAAGESDVSDHVPAMDLLVRHDGDARHMADLVTMPKPWFSVTMLPYAPLGAGGRRGIPGGENGHAVIGGDVEPRMKVRVGA